MIRKNKKGVAHRVSILNWRGKRVISMLLIPSLILSMMAGCGKGQPSTPSVPKEAWDAVENALPSSSDQQENLGGSSFYSTDGLSPEENDLTELEVPGPDQAHDVSCPLKSNGYLRYQNLPVYELQGDDDEKSAIVTLTPECPVAVFSNGIRVDFSADGLTAEEKLTVTQGDVEWDGDADYVEYDFTIGEGSVKLPLWVEVTVPIPEEWDGLECYVEVFDDEKGKWLPIYSETDQEASEVTFYPQHFSKHRLCSWDDSFVTKRNEADPPEKRSIFFYATENPEPDEELYLDLEAFKARCLRNGAIKDLMPPGVKKDYLQMGINLTSFGTDASGNYVNYLQFMQGNSDTLEALSKNLSGLGTSLTVANILYNAINTGDLWGTLKDHWDDLAKMAADYAMAKAGASAACGNVVALLWLIYQGEKAIGEEINTTYRLGGETEEEYAYRKFTFDYVVANTDTLEIRQFYNPDHPEAWGTVMKLQENGGNYSRMMMEADSWLSSITTLFTASPGMQRTWNELLTGITKDLKPEESEKMLKRIKALITNYCDAYWTLDKKTLDTYLNNTKTSDGKDVLADVYKTPTAAEKAKYKERMLGQIYSGNKSVFEPLVKQAYVTMYNEALEEAYELLDELNQVVTIEIKDAKEYLDQGIRIQLTQNAFPVKDGYFDFTHSNDYRVSMTRYASILIRQGKGGYGITVKDDSNLILIPFEFSDPTTVLTLGTPKAEQGQAAGAYKCLVPVEDDQDYHGYGYGGWSKAFENAFRSAVITVNADGSFSGTGHWSGTFSKDDEGGIDSAVISLDEKNRHTEETISASIRISGKLGDNKKGTFSVTGTAEITGSSVANGETYMDDHNPNYSGPWVKEHYDPDGDNLLWTYHCIAKENSTWSYSFKLKADGDAELSMEDKPLDPVDRIKGAKPERAEALQLNFSELLDASGNYHYTLDVTFPGMDWSEKHENTDKPIERNPLFSGFYNYFTSP